MLRFAAVGWKNFWCGEARTVATLAAGVSIPPPPIFFFLNHVFLLGQGNVKVQFGCRGVIIFLGRIRSAYWVF